MKHYVIGIDLGTLSGRAVLADTQNGQVLASATYDYPHGVMDAHLPDGTPLPPDWALQHPQDYMDVLYHVIPEVMHASGIPKEQLIAIGIDCTASTAMPVDQHGTPLCMKAAYENVPHAYVKMWKHHAAQKYADRMTEVALARGESWLSAYGGKVSCEWSLPKLWQLMEEAPQIYEEMDAWIEAADWVVGNLCGRYAQNACAAGYKTFFDPDKGHPSEDYFAALSHPLRTVVQDKLHLPILPIGAECGKLTEPMAQKLGLHTGVSVAVGGVDAHVAVLAAGICKPGQMLSIIGTSTCHMALFHHLQPIPGISGAVKNGIIPGYYGYEAGQSCVGDSFAWLVKNMTPPAYHETACQSGLSVHQYLTQLAAQKKPGQSGLLALDWWNGNRSILADGTLSGMMLGLTLQTPPEDLYRALIESTAYGARMIMDTCRQHGLAPDAYYVTGGISQKNELAMQIYADVMNMPVHIVDSTQGGALGSAIMASVCAGTQAGGYDTFEEAIAAMAAPVQKIVYPVAENVPVYETLYQQYAHLHDYFGRGENQVMKVLHQLRTRE